MPPASRLRACFVRLLLIRRPCNAHRSDEATGTKKFWEDLISLIRCVEDDLWNTIPSMSLITEEKRPEIITVAVGENPFLSISENQKSEPHQNNI